MLKKVTLKKMKRGDVLYLRPDEAAILVTGTLHMITYEKDILVPHIARMWTPGDLIGLSELNNGWCRMEHCWSVAWQDCDLFFISADYLRYMWDQMK